MTIETTRFGSVAIDPNTVITMPRGLIGFPNARRFCLLEHHPGMPFRWLQSIDDPSLALIVMDPVSFFPDYEVDVSSDDAELLGIQESSEALVLTTITVRHLPDEVRVTTNLLGPLVVGLKERKAVQLVMDADRYSTQQPLPVHSGGKTGQVLAPAA